MSELWVKLGNNRATQVSTEGCSNVDKFLEACQKKLSKQLGSYDIDQLSLSTTEGGEAIRPGLPLTEILNQPGYSLNDDLNPLFIRVVDNSSSQTPIAKFERRQSDEKFIQDNNLDLYSNEGMQFTYSKRKLMLLNATTLFCSMTIVWNIGWIKELLHINLME